MPNILKYTIPLFSVLASMVATGCAAGQVSIRHCIDADRAIVDCGCQDQAVRASSLRRWIVDGAVSRKTYTAIPWSTWFEISVSGMPSPDAIGALLKCEGHSPFEGAAFPKAHRLDESTFLIRFLGDKGVEEPHKKCTLRVWTASNSKRPRRLESRSVVVDAVWKRSDGGKSIWATDTPSQAVGATKPPSCPPPASHPSSQDQRRRL